MRSDQLLNPTDVPLRAVTVSRKRNGTRHESRKPRGNYKKLLWFKQPCKSSFNHEIHNLTYAVPDNYTDEKTFLDALQRNPRLQPYEFWSLMIDATVIVQHLASVAIFCCCF